MNLDTPQILSQKRKEAKLPKTVLPKMEAILKTVFKNILSIFEVKPLESPFVTVERKAPQDKTPDNLKYTHTRQIPNIQTDKADGLEADIWTPGHAARTNRIGQPDIDIIKDRHLKDWKYRELKQFWAAGLSASETAKKLINKTGYGQRTLEKYWSAFFSSSATLPTKEGSGTNINRTYPKSAKFIIDNQ